MKLISKNIYDRLQLQAEEARELGLVKLADNLANVLISVEPTDVKITTAATEEGLSSVLSHDLWKIALEIIEHYDVTSADANKIETAIKDIKPVVLAAIKQALQLNEGVVSPREPLLPGQIKSS